MKRAIRRRIPVALLYLAIPLLCSAQSLSNVTFVAFDVETTGLSRTKDRIVEIAASRYCGGRIVASRAWLVNPGIPIPAEVQGVHGITDRMVAGQPAFGEVLPQFAAFASNAVLLAHNAPFDVGFVRAEARRCGLAPPTNAVLDSLKLSRRWFPGRASYALRELAADLKIDTAPVHRAQRDSDYLLLILERGLATMPANASLQDLQSLAGKPLRFPAAKKAEQKPEGL